MTATRAGDSPSADGFGAEYFRSSRSTLHEYLVCVLRDGAYEAWPVEQSYQHPLNAEITRTLQCLETGVEVMLVVKWSPEDERMVEQKSAHRIK